MLVITRSGVIASGILILILSLVKAIPITERVKAQFRMDAFNVFNHPVYAFSGNNGANNCVDCQNTALTSNNGRDNDDIEAGTTMRELQFALRFSFLTLLILGFEEGVNDSLLFFMFQYFWSCTLVQKMRPFIAILVLAFCTLASAQSVNSHKATGGADVPSAPEFAHARQLLQQGKYDEAIAELQQLSSAQPGMKGVAHELGMAYFKKSDYPQATETFKKALQQDPEDNEATQLLGLSGIPERKSHRCDPLPGKSPNLVSARQCRRFVHPRPVLYPDQRLSPCAAGVRENV